MDFKKKHCVLRVCVRRGIKVNIFLQYSSFRTVGQMNAPRCNAIKYIIYNALSCPHFKININIF